jgi:hypothetical protein
MFGILFTIFAMSVLTAVTAEPVWKTNRTIIPLTKHASLSRLNTVNLNALYAHVESVDRYVILTEVACAKGSFL